MLWRFSGLKKNLPCLKIVIFDPTEEIRTYYNLNVEDVQLL
jgi:hypothetical protein